MRNSRTWLSSLLGLIVLLQVLLFVGCGGGGGTTPQQQLPPADPQAAMPDTTTIVAIVNLATNAFSMGGGANSLLPNATVFIEDSQNFVSNSKTAAADGSFEITEADIPPNFLRTPGSTIRIFQFTPTTERSEPATVTLQGI